MKIKWNKIFDWTIKSVSMPKPYSLKCVGTGPVLMGYQVTVNYAHHGGHTTIFSMGEYDEFMATTPNQTFQNAQKYRHKKAQQAGKNRTLKLFCLKRWIELNPRPFVERIEINKDKVVCSQKKTFKEGKNSNIEPIANMRLDRSKYCQKFETKKCPYFSSHDEYTFFCDGSYYTAAVIYENGRQRNYIFPSLESALHFKMRRLQKCVSKRKRIVSVDIHHSDKNDDFCVVAYANPNNNKISENKSRGIYDDTNPYVSEMKMWRELNTFIQGKVNENFK